MLVATNLISVPSLIYVNPITRKQFRYKIPGLAVDIKVIGAFCLPNLICFLLAWGTYQCALNTGIVFRSRRSYGDYAMSKGIDEKFNFAKCKNIKCHFAYIEWKIPPTIFVSGQPFSFLTLVCHDTYIYICCKQPYVSRAFTLELYIVHFFGIYESICLKPCLLFQNT